MPNGMGNAPVFDGTDYTYWKARMQAYLESVDPIAWSVTVDGYPGTEPPNAGLVKANAKAKNILFEGITKNVFSRINSSGTAHQIWNSICAIHEGSKDVKEERFHILKSQLESLKMLPHERANDVYARMHVLVERINALGANQIEEADVIRHLLRLLPREAYGSIVTYIFQLDFANLKIDYVLGKLHAFEGYHLGLTHESTPDHNLALKAKEAPKKKKKKPVVEDEEDDDEDGGKLGREDLALMMRKFGKAFKRMYPTSRKDLECYKCGEKGHFARECTNLKTKHKGKRIVDSDDEDEEPKPKYKPRFKKKTFTKDKTKGKDKRRAPHKANMAGEWVSDSDDDSDDTSSHSSSSSDDDHVAGLAVAKSSKSFTSPPLSLMARSHIMESDESDEDDSDDDEPPTYDDLVKLLKEGHSALIKMDKEVREVRKEYKGAKAQVSELKKELEDLTSSHLALQESYDKLKGEHIELGGKCKDLELTLESTTLKGSNSSQGSPKSCISIASTSYDLACSCDHSSLETNILKEYHELKKEREAVLDGFERLTRGRTLQKEILSRNLVNNVSRKGLGSYPAVINTSGTSETIPKWVAPLLADDYYCDKCCMDGHTSKECPKVRSSIAFPNANLFHENTHFKLYREKDGKVKAKALGPPDKTRRIKQIWVPKSIVDRERKAKFVWAPKTKV